MSTLIYQVGMAELKVASAPGKLITLGLGSCVAVCGYDPALKIAGMVHVMLPTNLGKGDFNPAKFGDTAVPLLLEEMERLGAYRPRIWVKIAGGARMFSFSSDDSATNIGLRNVLAIEDACRNLGITIAAQSVGGTMGRSVFMDIETGDIEVRTINRGTIHL